MPKNKSGSSKIPIDTKAGSLAYNRFEMQVSQSLNMAIELFDNLDYLLVLDYYDDISIFDCDRNPKQVSYYQMKTNEESISISTAISESWLSKLYSQLENTEWIVQELGLITNCPLKIVFKYNDDEDNPKRKTELHTSEKTSFSNFNMYTVNKIKEDIASKNNIKVEDVDLSKFVHMRTTLSIPSHKEIVENKVGDFLHNKYPRITIDSVKAIYATMMDLLTKRQQYELLPENASYAEVRKHKGGSKHDFKRVIEKAIMVSIPPFNEIMNISNLGDDEKYKASFEYTQVMTDSQSKSISFINLFEAGRDLVQETEISEDESSWQYVNRVCDILYEQNKSTKVIYNKMYVCVLITCILINETRKSQ
ncbi:MAG: hypothetical protein ACRC0V_11605 [Fusobacteriaceae bacterium]